MVLSVAESVCIKRCRLVCEKVSVQAGLQKLVRYFSSLSNSSILGGADLNPVRNRYSYFAAEPVEVFEFFGDEERPFEKLRTVLKKYCLDDSI